MEPPSALGVMRYSGVSLLSFERTCITCGRAGGSAGGQWQWHRRRTSRGQPNSEQSPQKQATPKKSTRYCLLYIQSPNHLSKKSASNGNGTPRRVRRIYHVHTAHAVVVSSTPCFDRTTPSYILRQRVHEDPVPKATPAPAYLPIPVGGVDRMAAVAQPRVRRHVLERLEYLYTRRHHRQFTNEVNMKDVKRASR